MRSRSAQMAADFYRRLFAADPTVEHLFLTEPEEQRAKLVAELDEIVGSIKDHQPFLARAAALGRRHATYGVRARDYASVRAALLGALAAASPSGWPPELADAWE